MNQPFPSDESLCEQCGYPLKGLSLGRACPECGHPVKASSPEERPGLPWQDERTLRSFLVTVWRITVYPRHSFRRLRLGPTERGDDAYLFIFAIGLGITAAVLWQFTTYSGRWGSPLPWLWGASATIAIVLLTWIEAMGVTYFSKRHGWRVSWRHAQRVASYSAVGWVPGVAALFVMIVINERGLIRAGMPPNWQVMWEYVDIPVFAAVLGISILWFETLVWMGIRQVKFGNWSETEQLSGERMPLDGDARKELT